MPFNPIVNQEISVNGKILRIAGHPGAPALPYGQEGRMATVYKVTTPEHAYALKVFKAVYRTSHIQTLSDKLKPFAQIAGLEVCDRYVIDPNQHKPLIRQEPDLSYAVLMPWADGQTWMDTISERAVISKSQCAILAQNFCHVLTEMEKQQVAHCDLSAPNVIIRDLNTHAKISLVDVEQIFSLQSTRPQLLLAGTPGYAPIKISDDLWGSNADRFAGAILLAEMLGWHDKTIQRMAWGESFFDPDEMQKGSERFQVLVSSLEKNWGKPLSELFRRVWEATTLEQCPTFREWEILLARGDGKAITINTLTPSQPKMAPHAEVSSEVIEDTLPAIPLLPVFEQAIATAQQKNLPYDDYILKINKLSLRQVYQYFGVSTWPHFGGPKLTIVRPFVAGKETGKRFGGFTGCQYALMLFLLPIFVAGLFFALKTQYATTQWWGLISSTTFLSAVLYTGLRRKWIATLIYVPVAFMGGVFANIPIDIAFVLSLFFWVVISGTIFEMFVQLGIKFVRDPIKNKGNDLLWAIFLGVPVGIIFEEGSRPGLQKIDQPSYLILSIALAILGWVIGRFLNSLIIQLREYTK